VKINKEWHLANRMPEKPTLEEKINWHILHARNCSCRPIPDSIKKDIGGRLR